jgi:hypothetical protein
VKQLVVTILVLLTTALVRSEELAQGPLNVTVTSITAEDFPMLPRPSLATDGLAITIITTDPNTTAFQVTMTYDYVGGGRLSETQTVQRPTERPTRRGRIERAPRATAYFWFFYGLASNGVDVVVSELRPGAPVTFREIAIQ